MNRAMLAGLLALQVLIVGAVLAWNVRPPEQPDAFFDFNPDEITALQILTEDDTIDVHKANDTWELGDGKPADSEKVKDVLDKLANASTGWPVATSASTAERFEVTEDSFQKRLTLYAGEDVVADAFFGTSPGYRKVHVSDVSGGPVFAVEFSNYELGSDNSSWLNKSLLRPEGALRRLVHDGEYVLNKVEDEWVAENGTELDKTIVDKVIGRFENLNVYTISDALLPSEPKALLTWTDDRGDTTLSLYHFEEEDDWVATSDRVDGQYGISTYIAKEMAMTLEELLPMTDESEEGEAAPVD